MAVKIGSARSSFGNTTRGDQHGGLEVSTQDWYNHSKGWVVFRAKDPAQREKIAQAMERACANNNIGYSQPDRLALRNQVKDKGFDPAKATQPTNTDCSALVRVCCNFAGIDVGNFITSTEATMLMGTGRFNKYTDDKHCKSSTYLMRGDILNTRSKGHTVVVLSNGSKYKDEKEYSEKNTSTPTKKPTTTEVKLPYLKNGDENEYVIQLQKSLIELGYDCGRWGVDGEFGDATEIALRAFQTDHNIESDGIVGPSTWAALEAAASETPDVVKQVKIVGGSCYVRDDANTKGKTLGVAKVNQIFEFAGETSTTGWNKIVFNGASGWVSGKYSTLI